jgi:hypothetical protein
MREKMEHVFEEIMVENSKFNKNDKFVHKRSPTSSKQDTHSCALNSGAQAC